MKETTVQKILGIGGICLIGLFILAMIVFPPIIILWSLNTLFGLAIEYSIVNWLAVFALVFLLKAPVKYEVKR